MSDKALSFEEALARLDSFVRQLDKGDAPLDQALALFEEGTNLIGRCTKMLDEAEQKVVQLKKGPDGEPVEVPFDSEE